MSIYKELGAVVVEDSLGGERRAGLDKGASSYRVYGLLRRGGRKCTK